MHRAGIWQRAPVDNRDLLANTGFAGAPRVADVCPRRSWPMSDLGKRIFLKPLFSGPRFNGLLLSPKCDRTLLLRSSPTSMSERVGGFSFCRSRLDLGEVEKTSSGPGAPESSSKRRSRCNAHVQEKGFGENSFPQVECGPKRSRTPPRSAKRLRSRFRPEKFP